MTWKRLDRAPSPSSASSIVDLDRRAAATDRTVRELPHRCREPDLVERHRLESHDDPAQLLRGIARDGERTRCDPATGCDVAVVEGADGGVEHLAERGDVLHRPVVELLRDAAPLGALGEQPLGDQVVVAQSIIASRSAMATAWVRVSASSFARMWRTWLFTVSCEMKSCCATSAFDMPSARSCRISRSRCVRISCPSRPVASDGISAGSTNVSPGCDLLDRLEQRLVRRLLQDVAVRARTRGRAGGAPARCRR